MHGLKQKPTLVRWKPPTTGEYKVNFDEAVFVEIEEAGIEVVIRNEKGEVMVVLSEKMALPSSIEVLEMLAASGDAGSNKSCNFCSGAWFSACQLRR